MNKPPVIPARTQMHPAWGILIAACVAMLIVTAAMIVKKQTQTSKPESTMQSPVIPKPEPIPSDTEKEWAEKEETDRLAIQEASRLADPNYNSPVHGIKPKPSEWDGITAEVSNWLRANLNDFGSCQIISASEIKLDESGWCQKVSFRSKNAFGAFVKTTCIFVMSNGRVIQTIPSN